VLEIILGKKTHIFWCDREIFFQVLSFSTSKRINKTVTKAGNRQFFG